MASDDFAAALAAATGQPTEAPAASAAPQPAQPPQDFSQANAADWREGDSTKPVLASAAAGAAKGLMEAKDFLFGEPNPEDKWASRKWIEDRDKDLKRDSVVNGLASTLSQFGVGFVGLGKIKYVATGLEWASSVGKTARFAAESARGATAGGIFMDPHEDRLSNLVEKYPALSNPITGYLAANPADTNAQGRMKNALEGVVLDGVLAGALALVAKGVKLSRAGDTAGANAAGDAADILFERAANKESAEASSIDLNGPFDPEAHYARTNAPYNPKSKDLVGSEMVEIGERNAARRASEIEGRPLEGEVLPPHDPNLFEQVPWTAKDGNPWGMSDADYAVWRTRPENAEEVTKWERDNKIVDGDSPSGTTSTHEGLPTQTDSLSVDLRGGPRSDDVGVAASSNSGADGAGPPVSGGRTPEASAVGINQQGRGTGDVAPGGRQGPGPQGQAAAEVTPEQVAESLARLKKDSAALSQYGSREAAIEAGYRFKPDSDGASGVIPWQKLRTTEETQAWMGQVIDQQTEAINAARGGNAEGVLTDAAVAKMVERRAKIWNEDPAALMGTLKAAGDKAPEMAANMETSFLLANKAYQDAFELATRIKSDNFTGFGSRAEALAALQQRMAMATTMYANGKAIVSNSARSLRRMRGEFKITDAQIANIQSSDPEAILKLVYDTAGDPKALTDAGRYSMLKSVTDGLATFQAANLLWGWKTQVVNFATSSAMLVWRPLEANIGAHVLRTIGAVTGNEAMVANAIAMRSQSLREATYLGSVTRDGFVGAAKAFMDGDSILLPHNQEAFNVGGGTGQSLKDIVPEFKPINSMDDVTHNALEAAMLLGNVGATAIKFPLRALGAADEMVKTMRYRAIVLAKASMEADARGLRAGSQEYKDLVTERLTASVDDLGRGVDRAALEEAQASTFQNDLVKAEQTWVGGWSRGYSVIAAQNPIARLITPFIKTPSNLLRYGVKMTPGLNLLQREYTTALSGASGFEAQARATGQMSLGLLIAGQAMHMWATGNLVGAGPQNVEQKKQWNAMGNRGNSIVWHDEKGVKSSFELNRFDPIGMPIVLLADTASILTSGHLREEDQQGLAMSVTLALSHMVKDKTYLKNLSDALTAFTDDKKMEAFPKRVAPGFLPMSSLMSSINPDPVMHEARGVVDSWMAKIPGLSATLPVSRDFLGDPIQVPTGFVSAQRNSGPLMETLDQMFAQTGQFLEPPAARSAATGGVDLRDFKLKSGTSAYDRYQELAGHPPGMQSLKDSLTSLIQTKDFQALPHGSSMEEGTKAGVMMKIVKGYREGAWKRMLVENSDLRDAVYKRRIEIGQAVSLGRTDPKAAAGVSAQRSIGGLLQSYGLGGLLPR